MKIKNLCVYCSSSDALNPVYFEFGKELGTQMTRHKVNLVYGGAKVGLMGVVAKAVKQSGGKVIGVIPTIIHEKDLAYPDADELIITKDMRERKATMEVMADAFVALPGGFGTLEEIAEVITLKQLGQHNKPIILLNINNFYNSLLSQFEVFFEQDFSKPEFKNSFFVANTVADIFEHIENYQHEPLHDKWYKSIKSPNVVMQEID
jgi:cytokinin riboside 5'-monophosphate phosphoribohydrolase